MSIRNVSVLGFLLAIIIFMIAPHQLSAANQLSLANFTGGPPEGWFTFFGGSTVATTTQVVADNEPLTRPTQSGPNELLTVDFNVTDFGGFGQEFSAVSPQNWQNNNSFDFWFYGSGSGLSYQAEISDNRSDPNGDTSERFDYTFIDSTAGWQFISIPFTDFTRATDFQPGGAPDDGFTLTEIWAWAIVLPQGADVIYFDDFALGQPVIDDFETGLPAGIDPNGISVGFLTFSDGSAVAITTTASLPTALPGTVDANSVLQLDADVIAFAGFIHAFENSTVDGWIAQDWSTFEGLNLWLYGNNSGTDLFIDLLENRNPGSTSDDAERWTVAFKDDFSGWQHLAFPFTDFSRKEIGNGAPNDGLSLTEVYGWAFGTLNTNGPATYYIDDVGLYGVADVPELAVSFAVSRFDIPEGTTGEVTVKLNRPMSADDPAQVTVDYSTEPAIALANREYMPTAGTLTFVNGGPAELTFPIETFDDSKYEGDERIVLRLSNLVDVAPGYITQASAFIADNDPYDPNLLADFEQGAFLWESTSGISLTSTEITAADPLAVPGQDAYEHILMVNTPILVDIVVRKNRCDLGKGLIPVALLTTATFDATTVDVNTVRFGNAAETHRDEKSGEAKRHVKDFDGDGDLDLLFHFRAKEIGYECGDSELTFTGTTTTGQSIINNGTGSFGHDFAVGQDWSRGEALRFWYYGTGSGDAITVELKENRAPDPGPTGWNLVWSDEFNDPAGTPPNEANWSYEIGDVTPDGKNGWGNEELQYYTDDPANAATDGNGNLALTLREADGSLECYYGTCEYTSARLISWHKAEFAYGRIESRIKVPQGTGIWPAFWSLGTDIDVVSWPQTGEIDFMEFVGRLPNEIFGTIHGPGYSGGQSFGNDYQFGEPVFNDYHTFTVEWQPDRIEWYVDGILYHTATPADVAPNEWVFNDPVFLLLNVAVGGNFGGAVGEDLIPPQSMLVDYVRVYQGPDSAERWEATFADTVSGWQEVVIPFDAFTRSASQPAGAPDDGLTFEEVWGYGFQLPGGGTSNGTIYLDQVQLQLAPPPMAITVTNLNNSGNGSLRQALADIAIGGTISFDPALAGGTINLTNGPLVVNQAVTIDATNAPDIALNGGGSHRLLIVEPGVTATVYGLTFTNGYGFQLAGGILNNGALTLDHVLVTGNTMTTDAGDFWQGGAGIYNGEGSSLTLLDSTIANNNSGWAGGGLYAFFNTTLLIERSTISGNTAQDVGGGMRTLGDVTLRNSTLSDNESIGWHGGAAFVTDGTMDLLNSTIAGNRAATDTTGGLFVGTFGDTGATIHLSNTIIANNSGANCFAGYFGAGPVLLTSVGYNLSNDSSCNLTATGDQPNTDPLLGPLADNGGPTMTHALTAGSPAIDAADSTACPAIDQRGVARPQGAGCDIGAYESDGTVTSATQDVSDQIFLPLVTR